MTAQNAGAGIGPPQAEKVTAQGGKSKGGNVAMTAARLCKRVDLVKTELLRKAHHNGDPDAKGKILEILREYL